ncbi:glycosyltransferase family 4 protein [Alphaproteobacteria bacterium]|nr:glycosyltransferase family 4 protein [Alphaproteobacteria bacterium]
MEFVKKIKVLMVTGVYFPEMKVNGAILQVQKIINALKNNIYFEILTDTREKELTNQNKCDGIKVNRVFINIKQPTYFRLELLVRLYRYFIHILSHHIIHIHGYSKRNALIILLARLLRKRIIIKLTSLGKDDPLSIKHKSYLGWLIFCLSDYYIATSKAFLDSCLKSNIPEKKYKFIPNCVNANQFSKYEIKEKNILRMKMGYSKNEFLLLFVGHFSKDKQPQILYEAWKIVKKSGIQVKLIFIGRTHSSYEVDPEIANRIKSDAHNNELSSEIIFIEQTNEIDNYMKISDLYIQPSRREGLPNAMLEAMSSSLPCIVRKISGVTDWVLGKEAAELLVDSDDPKVFADKIVYLINNPSESVRLGKILRQIILDRFLCKNIHLKTLSLYRSMFKSRPTTST